MSQHDYNIANQTTPNTRADLNLALAAIVTQNSGATEPGTTFANMVWYDTTNHVLKIRNEANSAWITVGTADQANAVFNPNFAPPSQAQAEAGVENTLAMTALRTSQAIAAKLSAWELVTSTTTISSGAMTITGLSAYKEIMAFVTNARTLANGYRILQVGYSGGGSWITSGYYNVAGDDNYFGMLGADGNASGPKRPFWQIDNFNKSLTKFVRTGATQLTYANIDTTQALDSIRYFSASAATGAFGSSLINNGELMVYGRKY